MLKKMMFLMLIKISFNMFKFVLENKRDLYVINDIFYSIRMCTYASISISLATLHFV